VLFDIKPYYLFPPQRSKEMIPLVDVDRNLTRGNIDPLRAWPRKEAVCQKLLIKKWCYWRKPEVRKIDLLTYFIFLHGLFSYIHTKKSCLHLYFNITYIKEASVTPFHKKILGNILGFLSFRGTQSEKISGWSIYKSTRAGDSWWGNKVNWKTIRINIFLNWIKCS